jgi:hypothetical protein
VPPASHSGFPEITSSCQRSPLPDPCGCGHWCACADREPAAATMTQAAVAAEVHQTLDVHRGFATQVAFDLIVAVDGFADLQNFSVGELIARDAQPGYRPSRRFPVRISNRSRECTSARSQRACAVGMLTPAIRATPVLLAFQLPSGNRLLRYAAVKAACFRCSVVTCQNDRTRTSLGKSAPIASCRELARCLAESPEKQRSAKSFFKAFKASKESLRSLR